MSALVTGAGGFLGRAVVDALLAQGHDVRAMIRPASAPPAGWGDRVEVVRADLRRPPPLAEALAGVDAVVHLAADMRGDEDDMFAATVLGTERLLEAVGAEGVRRVVLASSFAVYDWTAARGVLDERSPVAAPTPERGGYPVAKIWQERVARRLSAEHGFELVVLRPGFVWGPGAEEVPGTGQSFGRVHVVVGGRTRLPLTYVENCAEAFALAAAAPAAAGGTFNVVDDGGVPAWRYATAYLRGTGTDGVRIVVPYTLGRGLAGLAEWTSTRLFGRKGRLPSILDPPRFEARFKPLRFSNARAREGLGWRPRYGFSEALRRTFPALPAPPAGR